MTKAFAWRGSWKRKQSLVAVDRVDLDVERGECLALVGESGSGKTTLGRCLLRLMVPDSGEVCFDGVDLLGLSAGELRRRRTDLQMVFQDSVAALDPRISIGAAIADPIRCHRLASKAEVADRVDTLLQQVGLSGALSDRYPHQLSGGQRQRVGIARALATEPKLMLLDEPVSALDVSVRAQILSLLTELQRRLSLTLIIIAHDLGMVEQIADRVAVMYLGRIVEIGSCRTVFRAPKHPYTRSLLQAVPVPDPRRRHLHRVLPGEIPSPLSPPAGCSFHPRCPMAQLTGSASGPACQEREPVLSDSTDDHRAACHYPLESSKS